VQLIDDAGYAVRFLAALHPLLRNPLTPSESRALVRQRLATREADFLDLARRTIYRRPSHPVRRLLDLAGCLSGDLEQLVEQEGLEGALRTLFRRGVYLTIDEFKGRKPIQRGSASFTLDPTELLNPLAARHLPAETGGSRGHHTVVPWDIRYLRDEDLSLCLLREAISTPTWRYASWAPPGSIAIMRILGSTVAGAPPSRWFSQVDPSSAGLQPRYRWSAHCLRLGALLAGVSLPRPESVPLADPLPIVRWMAGTLSDGGIPCVSTTASCAVRICQAALAAGIDLANARLVLGGEPTTPARLATIQSVGAVGIPSYRTMDLGRIGQACPAGQLPDEMHLMDDLLGVVQAGEDDRERSGLIPKTLLFTTLQPLAPFVLINVSLGDQAEVVPARCGCPLQRAGWVRQIHSVRSSEKVTTGGISLLDSQVIRALEEVLPGRFGGGALDYQLVESLEGSGRAALRLLVHPRLGPLDERALVDAFLAAVGGKGADRVRELLLHQGGMLVVERAVPHPTAAGKVLHLHQERTTHPTALHSSPPAASIGRGAPRNTRGRNS